LLTAAEPAKKFPFHHGAFWPVTVDKNIRHQQNITRRNIAILISVRRRMISMTFGRMFPERSPR